MAFITKKHLIFFTVFLSITLIGLVINHYLGFGEKENVSNAVFYSQSLKSAVISAAVLLLLVINIKKKVR